MSRTSTSSARARRDRGSSTAEYSLMVAALAAGLVGVIMAAGAIAGQAAGDTCSSISSQLRAGGDCGAGGSSTQPGDAAGHAAPPSEDPMANSLGAATTGM